MSDFENLTTEHAENAEPGWQPNSSAKRVVGDEHSWIPEIEISVNSVRSVVEAFARRQAPAIGREESNRV